MLDFILFYLKFLTWILIRNYRNEATKNTLYFKWWENLLEHFTHYFIRFEDSFFALIFWKYDFFVFLNVRLSNWWRMLLMLFCLLWMLRSTNLLLLSYEKQRHIFANFWYTVALKFISEKSNTNKTAVFVYEEDRKKTTTNTTKPMSMRNMWMKMHIIQFQYKFKRLRANNSYSVSQCLDIL